MENSGILKGFDHGFWGDIDSTVDWCEPNYVITSYIAEFFNTMSSLPMAFWSIIGIFLTRKYATKEWKFFWAFAGLGGVGIGSALFHGTLRFHAQLLDEFPMLMGSTALLYCYLQSNEPPIGPSNKPLIIGMCSSLIIIAICYIYLKIWNIFIISYMILVVSTTYNATRNLRSLSTKLILGASFCYYGGLICWLLDLWVCHRFQQFHLHSIWHLGAGYGSYLLVLLAIAKRGDFLKKQVNVKTNCQSLGAQYVTFTDV